MPRTRKDEAMPLVDTPAVVGRYAELDDYAVSFETFPGDADGTEHLKGLPDDRCPCPHWGMILSGRLTLRYPDRVETYDAGDVYYAPPGHVPLAAGGTETVEFSPTPALRQTMTVVAATMAGAPTAGAQ
jgi:hypothetical protein